MVHVRSEDNLLVPRPPTPPFYHVGSRGLNSGSQVVRLDNEYLYWLSHTATSKIGSYYIAQIDL